METVIEKLQQYLKETLDLAVEPKLEKRRSNIPFFLRELYTLYGIALHGKFYVLAVARQSENTTPAALRKHLEHLEKQLECPCIYVDENASSYNRKRLMKHKVQFVIPRRQIYLPSVGIAWQDRSRHSPDSHAVTRFTPSTQTVLLYALTQRKRQFFPLQLAKALKYSSMTMTRALNELESMRLGKTMRKGKERWFTFSYDALSLWKQIEPLMQNPVKKRIWLNVKDNLAEKIKKKCALASISALSKFSMVSSSKCQTYAMSSALWKNFEHLNGIQVLPIDEEANIEIEIWHYDPMLFAKKGMVDEFSLYLSLRETQNERVEMALEKMIENIEW